MERLYTAALCLALSGALTTSASAGTPYNQLIVFGASFEDSGQFPDIDFVSLAAPTRARVVLSAEMSGTLWRGEAAIIALKPGEPWSPAP